MDIVVCVKYVPDAAGERTFAPDNTIDRVGSTGILSELDEYAVEEALRLVEAGTAGEVTVLTVGPEGAADAIKKSLQMGADKGVHVSDEALHGTDALGTSLVLAEAITKLGNPDLVLMGMSSTDAIMGVVPAMVAQRLGRPQLTLASEIVIDGSSVTIKRDGESATEQVKGSLPAVVSVTDQTGNTPRYPSFKGIMAAKKKPVETWSLADLGVDPAAVGAGAAWTVVEQVTPRPPRAAGTIIKDDGTGGDQLVAFLASRKLV